GTLPHLLDAQRDPVAVQRPEVLQRFEDHQVEGALKNGRLRLRHTDHLWDVWRSVAEAHLGCQEERKAQREGEERRQRSAGRGRVLSDRESAGTRRRLTQTGGS